MADGTRTGGQLLSLAQSVGDPALLLEAHRLRGHYFFFSGEFAPAREQLEQALALYDPRHHRSLVFAYGIDSGVVCLNDAAFALWYLGYADQALKRSQEALTLAQELAHPLSLAFALATGGLFHQLRREVQVARERAEATIVLSSEQGFALYLAIGTHLRGWALAEQGQGEEGIAQIRQGLAAHRATGAELLLPYYLTLLAEAHRKMGQAEEGLSMLAEALVTVDRTGERMYEAEVYRLKGELTLAQSSVQSLASSVPSTQHPTPSTQSEAETCFHQALEIARKQQAKSLELRAVMSLSQLWQQQGKKDEAWQMLAEIYSWFTEGFDTKDLQEAKALLEELS